MKSNALTVNCRDRRSFIGGSEARVIIGRDEKAPHRPVGGKVRRGRAEDRKFNRRWTGRGTNDRLLAFLPESDAGATAILFDEFDSGLPKSGLDFLSGVCPAAQGPVLCLKPFNRGD
jgi:hypothetical protein